MPRGIIVILSKLTANNPERDEDRFSEEIACRFSAGGALMKFKKHLSFVMHRTSATQSLAGSRKYARRGPSAARDTISRALPHEYLNWILKAQNHHASDHLQSRISSVIDLEGPRFATRATRQHLPMCRGQKNFRNF